MNKIEQATLLSLLKTMLKIRMVEEYFAQRLLAREIRCPVHLYVGQEGIAAGVCENLRTTDYVFSTHRSHGHYIAKGGDVNSLVAEVFCKGNGCSGGYGGSMHINDARVNYLASSAIVAGSIPLAAGTALASKLKNDDRISVAFFGDGATDEGVFWETVNIAALLELPVLFVCENNFFSTHMPITLRQAEVDIHKKAAAFGINTTRIEGNDVETVYATARSLIEHIRDTRKPMLLECLTFRWLAHVGPDPDLDVGYRRKEEVEKWRKKCPIQGLKTRLLERKLLSEPEYLALVGEIEALVEEADRFRRAGQDPSVTDFQRTVGR
jgi:TPP-dependent pyruvate/acetoin dehydrogenase alpha subunit